MTYAVMTWPNVPCAKLPHVFYDLVYHMTWNSMHGDRVAGTKLTWT